MPIDTVLHCLHIQMTIVMKKQPGETGKEFQNETIYKEIVGDFCFLNYL